MIHSAAIIKKRRSLLEKIKRIAKEKNFSHEVIGASIGTQQQTVNRVLNGKFSPHTDMVIALADSVGYELTIVEKDKPVARVE